MASPLHYLTEGSRIFLNSSKNRFFPKKYTGHAQEICQQVVKDCWNGTFFQTSTGNFPQFWSRDFGWCVSSLLKLGYQQEVQQTLRYAFNRFYKYNFITTTITPHGKPYDFPTYAVDSLPWFIHSLLVSKFPYYSYRNFLNQEIDKFFQRVIDPTTGLVKPYVHFSSIKDFAVRKSSCYDNCVVALLAKDLKLMKQLDNPFHKYNYRELLPHHFWNGEYFYDDLSKSEYVAGDANLFPLALGIIKEEEMILSAIRKIQEAGLDFPFPLKYTNSREQIEFIAEERFLRDYESTSIWTNMGPLYIKLVQQVNKELAAKYHQKYTDLIEKNGNYVEVFFPDETPFKTPFYYADRGMLWAANYLTL